MNVHQARTRIGFERLSKVRPEDIIDLMNHPAVRRHLPLARVQFGRAECDRFVAGKERFWEDHGYGPWAFVAHDAFIGWGGLQPQGDDVEIGLVLRPSHWGAGLGLCLEDGQFVAAFAFSTPAHAGTHMDAPYHFNATGDTADKVPLSRLVAPVVVIDARAEAANGGDCCLTLEAIAAHEAARGTIAEGSLVLMMTGWSTRWPDALAYLGGTDPTNLHFPSLGVDAARMLIESRGAAALGVDAASTDCGEATALPVHRLLGAANVPGLENLDGLDRLPPTGAWLIALPVKIGGGSGGPTRVVALLPP
ncbi:MAG: GNAT family N-acetyltransferase [Vicinamibacterales bacterium]